MRSAPRFQVVTWPWSVQLMIASSESVTMAASRARNASAALRSLTSRTTTLLLRRPPQTKTLEESSASKGVPSPRTRVTSPRKRPVRSRSANASAARGSAQSTRPAAFRSRSSSKVRPKSSQAAGLAPVIDSSPSSSVRRMPS